MENVLVKDKVIEIFDNYFRIAEKEYNISTDKINELKKEIKKKVEKLSK